jgi:hypothetical protein
MVAEPKVSVRHFQSASPWPILMLQFQLLQSLPSGRLKRTFPAKILLSFFHIVALIMVLR